ncbi:alpha/beta fold hydrolase [Ohtaekwangia sp.]|uniref:alpha/beta fold hydrolase n=1 Tax=Ohtaekwangia sp. TaxID=2066019 RepID=UPI002F9547F0
MKDLYLLSGLGADRRVFDFLDLSGYRTTCIEWVEPAQSETIETYAQRLLDQITVGNPILVGVSFGGMIAIEIGKLIKTEQIVLISSAKTRADIPAYYRFMGLIRFNRLMPRGQFKKLTGIAAWFFSVSSAQERSLLNKIICQTDEAFLEWAIEQIVRWKNKTVPANVILIHGTSDRLLPFSQADYTISQGGHFMVVNRSQEISMILRKVLCSDNVPANKIN